MQPRVGLVTFGAGLPNWRAAAFRLGDQARASGWFQHVRVLSDRSLKANYPDFVKAHSSVLQPYVRGYGYWIWKPFLVRQAMIEWAGSVDCVLYLDGGSEINHAVAAETRWHDYLEMSMEDSGRFCMSLIGHEERVWSKADVMLELGLTSEEAHSDQMQANPIFFRRGAANVQFLNEWSRLCSVSSYHLVDDAPSEASNSPGFREHRHDQAIFSGLMKTWGGESIPDETYWAPDWEQAGERYPIWTPRNRTRISVIDRSWRGKSIRFGERLYSKVYRELRPARSTRNLRHST